MDFCHLRDMLVERSVSFVKKWSSHCPFLIPLLLASLGIFSVEYQLLFGFGLLIFTLLLLVKISRASAGLALILTVLLIGIHYDRSKQSRRLEALAGRASPTKIAAIVTRSLKGDRVVIKELQSGAKLLLNRASQLQVGDEIAGKVWIRHSRSQRNPGGFDERGWLNSQGIAVVAVGAEPIEVVGLRWWASPVRAIASCKSWVMERLAVGVDSDDDKKVIHSMFLGERYGSQDALSQDYRHSGTMHVFAVSGLHVMMVGGLALLMGRLLQVTRWLLIPSVILVMCFYVGITGWGTPAVRALVMATVFLSAYLFFRKPQLLNSMAVSGLLILLFDSYQLFNAGFQLSYIVLLSIVFLSYWWGQRFAWLHYIEPFLPSVLYSRWQKCWLWIRKKFVGSLAVSIAAWMGSAPLIGLHFKMFSPVAILLGVPMVLSLLLVMWMSCGSLLLGLLHPEVSNGLNQLNAKFAAASRTMARVGADLPMGHVVGQDSARNEIVIFNMKRGAASYLGFGGGVLLDVGDDSTTVVKGLEAMGAEVDSVIFSHVDSEHCSGFTRLLEQHRPKQLMLPYLNPSSHIVAEQLDLAEEYGMSKLVPLCGNSFRVDSDVSLEVLFNGSFHQGVVADDKGLVVLVNWSGFKILWMSDAGYYVEKYLLDNELLPEVDVLVLGKHADERQFHREFFERAQAKVIVASDYRWDVSQQRASEWKKSVASICDMLFLQSQHGAVKISQNENGLLVTSTLDDLRCRITSR